MTHKDVDKRTKLFAHERSFHCVRSSLSRPFHSLRAHNVYNSLWKYPPQHKTRRSYPPYVHKILSPEHALTLALTHITQLNLVHNSIFPSTVSVLCRLFWPIARVTQFPSSGDIQENKRSNFRGRFTRHYHTKRRSRNRMQINSADVPKIFKQGIKNQFSRALTGFGTSSDFSLENFSFVAKWVRALMRLNGFICVTTINLIESDKTMLH